MSDPKSRDFVTPGVVAVSSFTLVYMLVALVAAVWLQNVEFGFYLVVMCVLIAAVASVHWKSRFSMGALWGLSIWGMAHMAGGLMPVPNSWPIKGDSFVLYNLWLIPGIIKYDQLVHAFGFGLITWICWQGIRKAFVRHGIVAQPTLGLLTICVASGMGFGAANEIVEFFATLLLHSTNVGGYENTGWDLVANFVGCILAAGLIFFFDPSQRNPRKPDSETLSLPR
jgi:hypothetical protein